MEKTIAIEGNKFILEEDGVYCGAYLGKMNVWDKDTDIVLETEGQSDEVIDKFIEKIAWLNDNKTAVLDVFIDENYDFIEFVNEENNMELTESDFRDALFVENVYIYINGRNSEFSFDLDTEPDYLCGHLANMIISGKYEIEFGGMNG
ncbi:hypothetical protein [Mogibacterium pumilum]|uniref:Uncharacterized protein n=1 Tax=Mogibacterium pumilum TaxID=86332 RepID=A0A223ASP1_9FIRM|nr:hypothetical protein [Mogibacterium pumilum]ASS38001.1 hypothetical protein AXF17_05890 [Mogibacterium pumilum]